MVNYHKRWISINLCQTIHKICVENWVESCGEMSHCLSPVMDGTPTITIIGNKYPQMLPVVPLPFALNFHVVRLTDYCISGHNTYPGGWQKHVPCKFAYVV